MGCGDSRPSFNSKRCQEVAPNFDAGTLRAMHDIWHKAAPTGEMTVTKFEEYLAGIAAAGEGGVRVNTRWVGDTQVEAAKLFRGYNLNSDDVMTFEEYIVSQEAVCHHTALLPEVVFRIVDRDLDGKITFDDIVALSEGVECIDHDDEFLMPIVKHTEGLWSYLAGGEDTCSQDRFFEACREIPDLHIKLLKLV